MSAKFDLSAEELAPLRSAWAESHKFVKAAKNDLERARRRLAEATEQPDEIPSQFVTTVLNRRLELVEAEAALERARAEALAFFDSKVSPRAS